MGQCLDRNCLIGSLPHYPIAATASLPHCLTVSLCELSILSALLRGPYAASVRCDRACSVCRVCGGLCERRPARAERRSGPGAGAPAFAVDKMWPKPLPNHWILGSVTGVTVDSQDHIWIVHRGSTRSPRAPRPARAPTRRPPRIAARRRRSVLEFDATGTLLGHWGGPGQGYDWPVSPGGIEVDAKGNVWITAAGAPDVPITPPRAAARSGGTRGWTRGGGRRRGRRSDRRRGARRGGWRQGRAGGGQRGGGRGPAAPPDAHILKFSRTGQFLLQIGKAGAPGDNDSDDGARSSGRRRRRYRRQRGLRRRRRRQPPRRRVRRDDRRVQAALGRPRHRRSGRVSCVALVEGRHGLRLRSQEQPHPGRSRRTARSSREAFVSQDDQAGTARCGTSRSRAMPQQRYVFVADGQDEKIFVLDRDTLETSSAASATAAASPARSAASAASASTRRATSTRARRSRASACRSSCKK